MSNTPARKDRGAKAKPAAISAIKPAKESARKSARPSLFTIGYEQSVPDALMTELRNARIELLVDVRAVAASRKPGFSKRQLAASLDQNGIGYLHLQTLGTPAEGRNAARAGNFEKLWTIYRKHLATPKAREAMDELIGILKSGRRVCILCFERKVEECHRREIAAVVEKRTGIAACNLVVPLF
jgi:uncharacterized protein (DUF488 family)